MGTGIVLILTAIFGAMLAAFLTGKRRLPILTATPIAIVVALAAETAAMPVFPLDSPNFPGALLRAALLMIIPVAIGAALGTWLTRNAEEEK